MAEEFRVLRPQEYHTQLVAKGKRADGRLLEETREVKLEVDAIKTADSSSLVKLGNTSLVCGCTTQVLRFQERNEDNEEVKIRVELPPICSGPSDYKTQNAAQLLTRTLKNIVVDTNCLDREAFHIGHEDCYWSVDVEVVCLNNDGSIIDAALLAILSALSSLTLKSDSPKNTERNVKLLSEPICSTFALIGDRIICDPNSEEEAIAQSIFSFTIDPATDRYGHINKIGGKAVPSDMLFKCIQLAKTRAKKLRHLLVKPIDDTNMDCG